MLAATIYDLMILIVLLIILISGYIVKSNIIKMLENSAKLESTQIKSGVVIVNTIYYAILIVILTMIATPFIIRFVAF